MHPYHAATEPPRLASLIGGLSLATDMAAGLSMETALRTCVLATAIGRHLGLGRETLADVYYTALLRFIGCTAYAHETAALFGGDDMAFLGTMAPVDAAKPKDVVGAAWRATRTPGIRRHVAAMANFARDPKGFDKLAAAHCDLAVALAGRLGMTERVIAALGQMSERFDGKGSPGRIPGDRIETAARVLHVAWRIEVTRAAFGPAEAVETVATRAGSELDPEIANAFLRRPGELLEPIEGPSAWDVFLAAEPGPVEVMAPGGVGEIAAAFAHFVDIKSPFTLGHSTGVAGIAAAAGSAARMSAGECESLRLAGLLHDIGRVSVPNGIWDKPGPLNASEWERVRLHPYYTERILAQSPLLAPLVEVAAQHHERIDGSGYYRSLPAAAQSRPARILAAADAYRTMIEERPHRRARTPADAARGMAAEATVGRLDREAVECVLAGAGQRPAGRLRGELPAALSEREAEVLCLLARGISNKAIADELVISPRTVQHHLEHIYDKTGIRTRAAAAVFAVVNEIVD